MRTDFRRALARLVPVFMPELLFRLGATVSRCSRNSPLRSMPTEFMPGKFFGSGTMTPID